MNAQGAAGVLAGFLICFAVIFVVAIVVHILFLLSLFRTMKRVRERNQEMAPGLVFLTLVPIFGIYWAVVTVQKIAGSLRREFKNRGWRVSEANFGRTVGNFWAWGIVASAVLSVVRIGAQLVDLRPIAMILALFS